jgi:hypothetical protein
MLFADPEWSRKTHSAIAAHIHANRTTIQRLRLAYHERTGIPLPYVFETSDGKYTPSFKAVNNRNDPLSARISSHSRGCVVSLGGKNIHLSKNKTVAKHQMESLAADIGIRRRLFTAGRLMEFFASRRIVVEVAGSDRGRFPGLFGLRCRGYILTWTVFDGKEAFATVVGRIHLLRQLIDPTERMVVLCDHAGGPQSLIDLSREIGVEFLTPEELVARVKDETDHGHK